MKVQIGRALYLYTKSDKLFNLRAAHTSRIANATSTISTESIRACEPKNNTAV